MMRSAPAASKLPQPLPLHLVEAKIVVALERHSYLLNDGRVARQALSCLVRPEVGDHVLAASGQNGQNDTPYILHVLERPELQQVQLSAPGAQALCIEQSEIALNANHSIAVRALHDVEVSAATGVLSLNSRNLFATVQDSLVQNVGNFIGKAGHYLLEVRQLLRLHGQQALVTAEQDVKVDAERISMG
ncbi:Protein of unknown function (DUF3540) [Herbaspirillum sp. CF444]|uniref:DUF3540 domain-containing protein n=1 Tax=Herbaspirillum sp. CF444 TaxID=1144319 RepID=UPI0002726873|nr:DUF3540 domain-containing protein [Herbaspirillum sp. CF444]EJL94083.1 Protein of unknown function (DUF3540) [Herbaspirillum sp. CF444]